MRRSYLARRKQISVERMREEEDRIGRQFSDYESAVKFISCLEAWFEHRWGRAGLDPGRMTRFDRLPEVDGLTPDFVVHFATPYVLCAEFMKTFRAGRGGLGDLKQVIGYSQWQPVLPEGSARPTHDVLLLLDALSDDEAAQLIHQAETSGDPALTPGAPIVILGCVPPSTDRVKGEWYRLKWREQQGNHRFSTPNVTTDTAADDLNSLLTHSRQHPIPVSELATQISARNPLIRDEPPPYYTLVTLVIPALNDMLTEAEKDALSVKGRAEKRVTRAQIMAVKRVRAARAREGHIGKALELLEKAKLARRVGDPQSIEYQVTVDPRRLKDLLAVLSERLAKETVRKLAERKGTKRRKSCEAPGQKTLF